MTTLSHGHTVGGERSPTFRSWAAMRQRVARHPSYANVRICPRWQKFANFLADMGERQDGKSLERLDNDGHYEPGNCCWADPSQQQRNKRVSSWRQGARVAALRKTGAPMSQIAVFCGLSQRSAYRAWRQYREQS